MNKSQITINFEIIADGKMVVSCEVTKGQNESLNDVTRFIASNLPIPLNEAVKSYFQQEKANAIH